MSNKPILIIAAISLITGLGLFLFHDKIVSGMEFFLDLFEKRDVFREFVLSLGPFGPLGFILIQAMQIVLSPIPGEATGLVVIALAGTYFLFRSFGKLRAD